MCFMHLDGKQVAIGSNDNAVYVYSLHNKENGPQAWEQAGRFTVR